MLHEIDTLPGNRERALLVRRTGEETVKTSVGYRDPAGKIWGWHGANPPTHYTSLPPWGKDKAAMTRKKLQGVD